MQTAGGEGPGSSVRDRKEERRVHVEVRGAATSYTVKGRMKVKGKAARSRERRAPNLKRSRQTQTGTRCYKRRAVNPSEGDPETYALLTVL
jgi:hypothetical protein